MSIKTMANKVTGKVSKQVLIAQKNSPVFLFGVGIIGVGATVVLACRATLKMSEVLEEGEELLKSTKKQEEDPDYDSDVAKKASFSVKLETSIKIAKLYAPAILVGVVSVGAITGSHVILKKRNAGLAAAYAIADKSFKDYRGRVIKDQGAEKDLEYRFGTSEREVVEEGPNGPEVRFIKGLDQNAIKAIEKLTYARVFNQDNDNWSEVPHQNQYFIQMVLNHARDALQVNGVIFLNDVYDMLGFPRTKAGQIVGWVSKPQVDPTTGEERTDGYIDFGVWDGGVYKGKEWVTGHPKAFLLDFNVDGNVLDILEEK